MEIYIQFLFTGIFKKQTALRPNIKLGLENWLEYAYFIYFKIVKQNGPKKKNLGELGCVIYIRCSTGNRDGR